MQWACQFGWPVIWRSFAGAGGEGGKPLPAGGKILPVGLPAD
jgi:hypothetical protein